eukprot:2238070-Pleurochrysis_carterae.AAC.1
MPDNAARSSMYAPERRACTCTRVYARTAVHIGARVLTHPRIYAHTCARTHARAHAYKHPHTCTHTYRHAHAWTRNCMHTCHPLEPNHQFPSRRARHGAVDSRLCPT